MKYILILSFILLSGCLMTRTDVKEAENKKAMQDQVVTLQKSNAEQSSRFQDFENDIRDLNGRVEVLEKQQNAGNADRDRASKLRDESISDNSKKLAVMQEALGKMEEQVSGLQAEIASLKEERTSKAAAVEEKSAKGSSSKLYQEGEEHFNQKDWKKAILSYQKFRDVNPKSKYFADATYKIGVAFQELKMKAEAKSFYEEVISKYPGSDAARRAGIRLKQVK